MSDADSLALTPCPEYDNSSVGETEEFALRHVWAAFKDWQVWLHILVYMSIIGPRKYTSVRPEATADGRRV